MRISGVALHGDTVITCAVRKRPVIFLAELPLDEDE
jgi:hypothetical protein